MRKGYGHKTDGMFRKLYDSVSVGIGIKKLNETGIYPNLSQIGDYVTGVERSKAFESLDILEQFGLVRSSIAEENGYTCHRFFLTEFGKYMLSEAEEGEVL